MVGNFTDKELRDFIGRQTAGYTRGLPLGIALFDDLGQVAPVLTTTKPNSAYAPSGTLVWTPGTGLQIWTGSAWTTM